MKKKEIIVIDGEDRLFLILCQNCNQAFPFNWNNITWDYPPCMCSSRCNLDQWYFEITCPHCKFTKEVDRMDGKVMSN